MFRCLFAFSSSLRETNIEWEDYKDRIYLTCHHRQSCVLASEINASVIIWASCYWLFLIRQGKGNSLVHGLTWDTIWRWNIFLSHWVIVLPQDADRIIYLETWTGLWQTTEEENGLSWLLKVNVVFFQGQDITPHNCLNINAGSGKPTKYLQFVTVNNCFEPTCVANCYFIFLEGGFLPGIIIFNKDE